MQKPSSIELEQLMYAACAHFAAKAQEAELDAVRHLTFKASGWAENTGLGGPMTRMEAQATARLEASRCRRLSELARELRNAAHGNSLTFIVGNT